MLSNLVVKHFNIFKYSTRINLGVALTRGGAPMPPVYGLPHAVIEPSALRAAKAPKVE
jgi:hypothetical protein